MANLEETREGKYELLGIFAWDAYPNLIFLTTSNAYLVQWLIL